MRTLKASTVAAALWALGGVAQAATLYTPAVGFTNVPVTCLAVNVGKKPVEVTMEQFDFGGDVSNTDTVVLDPGKGWAFNGPAGVVFYCKFTFQGGKKSVRGSACFAGGGGCLSAE